MQSTPEIKLSSEKILSFTDEGLLACSTLESIAECIERLLPFIGAKNFVYYGYLPVVDELYHIHNVSDAWKSHYIERNYYNVDPRVHYALQHNTPIRWSALDHENNLADEQRQVLLDAAKFGLGSGITFPIHGVGAEVGMLNISAAKGQLPQYRHADMMLLSSFAFNAHLRLRHIKHFDAIDDEFRKMLTLRELECMQWTVDGKTSWEIGQILGCKESTVSFHIKNVIEKLAANNRSQATAKVVRNAQVRPFSQSADKQMQAISAHVSMMSKAAGKPDK